MRDRAWRRAQTRRIKNKVKNWKWMRFIRRSMHDIREEKRLIGVFATTPHPCRCFFCSGKNREKTHRDMKAEEKSNLELAMEADYKSEWQLDEEYRKEFDKSD